MSSTRTRSTTVHLQFTPEQLVAVTQFLSDCVGQGLVPPRTTLSTLIKRAILGTVAQAYAPDQQVAATPEQVAEATEHVLREHAASLDALQQAGDY